MSKILITGSTGFIGRPLCALLKEQGHELIELSSKSFDITDPKGFDQLQEEEISHIIHLAANTFVPKSWDEPAEFVRTNVNGTQNVLDFARKKKAKVTFGCAYIYGPPQQIPITEQHPVEPNNPYALSKHMAEELCRFYAGNFDMDIVSLRVFNVFGPGQKKHFLIPMLVDQVLNEEKIQVRDLSPKRDYIYLQDVVRAFVSSLDMKEGFHAYNVAGGKSYSVAEIIDVLQEVCGTEKEVQSKETERKNEINDTLASYEAIKKDLGWEPEYDLKKGLEEIVRYHQTS